MSREIGSLCHLMRGCRTVSRKTLAMTAQAVAASAGGGASGVIVLLGLLLALT
jgi:hypothetical protein